MLLKGGGQCMHQVNQKHGLHACVCVVSRWSAYDAPGVAYLCLEAFAPELPLLQVHSGL